MAAYGHQSIVSVLKKYTKAQLQMLARLRAKRRSEELRENLVVFHSDKPQKLYEALAKSQEIESPKEPLQEDYKEESW